MHGDYRGFLPLRPSLSMVFGELHLLNLLQSDVIYPLRV